jgi:uncharacterized repeat protein (TIGR01451 family)
MNISKDKKSSVLYLAAAIMFAVLPFMLIISSANAAAPNLGLAKKAHPVSINPGGKTTFTTIVSNTGSVAATDIVLRVSLPEGLVFLDDGSREKEWAIRNMNPSRSRSIHYEVRAQEGTAPGNYESTSVASAANHGTVSATFSIEVRSAAPANQAEQPSQPSTQQPSQPPAQQPSQSAADQPDLEVVKSSDMERYNPGQDVVYTITVTNKNSVQADNIVIRDLLPEGFTWSETGESTVTVTLEHLAPGETWSESFVASTAETLEAGHYSNIVKVTTDNMPGKEITAEHTVELVRGEVLGVTGVNRIVVLLWTLVFAVLGYSVYKMQKMRKQNANTVSVA